MITEEMEEEEVTELVLVITEEEKEVASYRCSRMRSSMPLTMSVAPDIQQARWGKVQKQIGDESFENGRARGKSWER